MIAIGLDVLEDDLLRLDRRLLDWEQRKVTLPLGKSMCFAPILLPPHLQRIHPTTGCMD